MKLSAETIAKVAQGAGLDTSLRPRKKGPGRYKKPIHKLKKNFNQNNQFELTELQALHHQILRLKVAGLKHVDIAKRLGISAQTVGYTVRSSLGQHTLAMMQEKKNAQAIDFRAEINELLPNCIKAYKDALGSDDLGLRVKTATIVAGDFAGKKTPTQIEQRNLNVYLTSQQIEEVKQRGIENAKKLLGEDLENSPEIIEAEIVSGD